MVLTFAIRLRTTAAAAVTPGTEAALVHRARKGDHHAFEALVRRHKDSVLNVARRIVGDPDASEDVAQETFIKAYQHLHRFRRDAKFSTWLYRIAVNEARTYLRAQRRRRARWEKQRSLDRPRPAPEDPGEEGGPLVALLQEVPDKHRAALALFYLQELSLIEIADALGAPTGTVKAWLSRGRDRLRWLAKERGLL